VGRPQDRSPEHVAQRAHRTPGQKQGAVALANKNARIAWVLLTTDQVYTPVDAAA
jgi:hypothetical protein